MPTYNISVVIDPGQASSGARVVKTELVGIQNQARGVDTAVQRAFDFETGPAVAATGAVDAALEAVQTQATATGAAVERAYDKSGAAARRNAGVMVNSQAQVRASTLQLGQQFNDFSTQVLAGGSIITAFAQQSGQAAFALQGMNGAAGTVGRFLAGPWGTLIIIATTILAGFVAKLWESEEASEAAELGADNLGRAQSVLGSIFDLTSGKIERQNDLLIANARLTALNLRAEALQAEESSRRVFGQTGPHFSASEAQTLDIPGIPSRTEREAAAARGIIADLRAGRISPGAAIQRTEGIDFDRLTVGAKEFREAIIDLASVKPNKELADLIDASLDRGQLAPGLRRDGRGGGKPHVDRSAQRLLERVEDYIKKLEDEADALELRGLEAAKAARLAEFERQFNRAPTAPEKERIENALERIQLLGDEQRALDGIKGPLETYQRQQAALNDLLARGKINQEEFNQALAELPLQQALDQVDRSLTGTLDEYTAQITAIDNAIARAIKTVDDAEKAGIIDPEQAARRRAELSGGGGPDEIVVDSQPRDLRSRMIRDLNRDRLDRLRTLDEGLSGRPDLQRQAQLDGIQREYDERMELLRGLRDQELIDLETFEDRKTAILEDANEKRRQIEQAEQEVRLEAARSIAQSLLGVAEDYAGKQSGIYKAIFAVDKAFAIAQAILAMQQNIAQASKYGFPQNLPFIAGAVAQGAAILSNIKAVAGTFREGGYTGDMAEDRVAGVVHGREFVMNARATRENRSLLEALNSGRSVRSARAANDQGPSAGRPLNLRIDASTAPGVEFDVRQITEDDVEVIAKRVVARDAPRAVSASLRDRNSRMSKSLARQTTARPRRG